MRKINIAILGTIGVGKTTLLHEIEKKLLEKTKDVVVKAEPSVTIPFINDVLKHFYNDNKAWALPLQLCISAAQEAYFQELRESDYEYALMDMPFSSDIYSYSHFKRGRMSGAGHSSLVGLGSEFPFDVVILINEDKETTIKRVSGRNKKANNGTLNNGQDDVAIEDYSYLDEHIADFKEYQDVWMTRFKSDNPNVEIIELNHVPDINSLEYKALLDDITNKIETIK